MKTVKTIISKALIATLTLFFLGLAVAGSGTAQASTSEETTAACGVSDTQVMTYLSEHGYKVIQLNMVDGCCDRLAYTQHPYQTRVYIVDNRIIGHEDVI